MFGAGFYGNQNHKHQESETPPLYPRGRGLPPPSPHSPPLSGSCFEKSAAEGPPRPPPPPTRNEPGSHDFSSPLTWLPLNPGGPKAIPHPVVFRRLFGQPARARPSLKNGRWASVGCFVACLGSSRHGMFQSSVGSGRWPTSPSDRRSNRSPIGGPGRSGKGRRPCGLSSLGGSVSAAAPALRSLYEDKLGPRVEPAPSV